MAQIKPLTESQRKARRELMELANKYERGARVAREHGSPYAIEAERNARSCRFAADLLSKQEA